MGVRAQNVTSASATPPLKFIVVNDDSGIAPLLGSKASQRLNIITINTNNLKQVATVASTSVLDSFGDVFVDELVTLPGVAHFEIDSCVTPVVTATRRVPVALREPLKSELNKLQTMNVIAQVEEPTDWVSVVVARKKNGDLRICIDPHALNKSPEEGNIAASRTGRHSYRTIEGTCLLHHRSKIRLLACESR